MTALRRSLYALATALALLLGACRATPDAGTPDQSAPDDGRPPAPAGQPARIDLAAEPYGLLPELGGLWVLLGDRTLVRFDVASGRVDGRRPATRTPS